MIATGSRSVEGVLSRNSAAIARVQGDVEVGALPAGVEAVFGRDGAPTFWERAGSFGGDSGSAAEGGEAAGSRVGGRVGGWWRECSVPRAAALAMLGEFSCAAPVACYLHPFHPAAVAVALGRLADTQALIALLPPDADLAMFLACDDFSSAIEAHRLLIARDPAHLGRLLAGHPGLPTPGTFLRNHTVDEATLHALVGECQAVFAAEHARRLARVEALRAGGVGKRSAGKVVVATPSRFRLWDDAGRALADAAREVKGAEVVGWAHDDPLETSPLRLLELSQGAGAVMTTDLFRGNLQGLLPPEVALLAWATTPSLPDFDPECPRDRLLLAAEDLLPLAKARGWPTDRVLVAELPHRSPTQRAAPQAPVLIADTLPVSVPPEVEDMSSVRLMWERAAAEIAADPLVVGPDPSAYLHRLRREMTIAEAAFPEVLIIDRLLVPAWQQSLARRLLASGVPLRLWGRGWSALGDDTLASVHAGEVAGRDALGAAISHASVLLPPLPSPRLASHPCTSYGVPVVPLTSSLPGLLRSLTAPPAPTPPRRPLTPEFLRTVLVSV